MRPQIRANRLALFLFLFAVLTFILACGVPSVVTWPNRDGGECYSTLQRGCLDAILHLEP